MNEMKGIYRKKEELLEGFKGKRVLSEKTYPLPTSTVVF
jgi:hypothetical protein